MIVADEEMSLALLKDRQKYIQKDKNRTRTLPFYNIDSKFPNLVGVEITYFILDTLKKKNTFSWADWASGNELAIREAKFSIDDPKFRTYSVEILEKETIEDMQTKLLNQMSYWNDPLLNQHLKFDALELILQDKYAPLLFQEDMTKVTLPEKMDLITCIFGIMYVDDPQKVLDNAKRNLKPGGIFVFPTENQPYGNNPFVEGLEADPKIEIITELQYLYCLYRY